MAKRIYCTDRDDGTLVDIKIQPNADGSAFHVRLLVCDGPLLNLVMGIQEFEALRARLDVVSGQASERRHETWAPNRLTSYGRELFRIEGVVMRETI